MIKNIKLHSCIIAACLLQPAIIQGCKEETRRPFFQEMKKSYPDVKIAYGYFIKSFGLSESSNNIRGKTYWKLNDDSQSYFFLSGYLRSTKDSVMFVPHDYKWFKPTLSEYKLFDFKAKENASWIIKYQTDRNTVSGDSVIFRKKKEVNGEKYYVFEFHPYESYSNDGRYYKDRIFRISVSPKFGIVEIEQLDSINSYFLYKLTLYPNQTFIDHKGDGLDL